MHEQTGTGERPNADSRLHNNPHPEKFNTPLNGPSAGADPDSPGEEQEEAQEMHSVTCPHCGEQVPVTGDSNHSDEPAPPSEDEQKVQDDKLAKGVWKPGQREHPDAGKPDDYEVEPL